MVMPGTMRATRLAATKASAQSQLKKYMDGGRGHRGAGAFFNRDPLPRWSVGPVTLFGDACGLMYPFMGQGAAQAIENDDSNGLPQGRWRSGGGARAL
jgi:2-polyprenyl-6-methoxyphenol hydroxylase-like FAD-dependent oxidoreductase